MHWMRILGAFDALEGTEFTAASEPTRRRLKSLYEVAIFLSPAKDLGGTHSHANVNFVDPKSLSAWVRGTIGDAELADRMDEVIATDKAYSFLVPQLKRLIRERGSRCSKLLRDEPPT